MATITDLAARYEAARQNGAQQQGVAFVRAYGAMQEAKSASLTLEKAEADLAAAKAAAAPMADLADILPKEAAEAAQLVELRAARLLETQQWQVQAFERAEVAITAWGA